MKNRMLVPMLAGALTASALIFGWYGVIASPVLASQPAESRPPGQPEPFVTEPERSLIAAINRREKELDAREEALRAKEARLESIKADIDARTTELRKVHQDIESMVRRINEAREERIRRIVKIYETMNPEEAAPRLEGLDKEMAVMILSSMSEKKAAKLLEFVNVDKAVELSRMFRSKK
ncbi:MAG: hypothetical protein H3C68_00395 [Deltaproteobacteria bacterium]|nr:hypothetical protein [Deltaproteobacteria bacterium]MBZ0219292.1 hypothetical protein [Deltaproteobacteria bacterium]